MFQGDLATASDDELRAVVEAAELHALLPTLAQLTGDLSLLRDDLRLPAEALISPDLALSEEAVADGRELAFKALAAYRDAGAPKPQLPTEAELRKMIEFIVGKATDEWYPVLREELALGDEDLRAPQWHREEIAPDRTMRAAVIGAGMSGLL